MFLATLPLLTLTVQTFTLAVTQLTSQLLLASWAEVFKESALHGCVSRYSQTWATSENFNWATFLVDLSFPEFHLYISGAMPRLGFFQFLRPVVQTEFSIRSRSHTSHTEAVVHPQVKKMVYWIPSVPITSSRFVLLSTICNVFFPLTSYKLFSLSLGFRNLIMVLLAWFCSYLSLLRSLSFLIYRFTF